MIKKISYFLIALIVLALLLSPLFIKVKVECKSQFGACPENIASEVNKLGFKNLFQMKSLVKKIVNSSHLVSKYSWQYRLPDTLALNLIIKKPSFGILDKKTGNFGLVDSEGVILSISNTATLPHIVYEDKNLSVGMKVDPKELFALKLIEGVSQMYSVQSAEIVNESLVVELPSQIRVIFPSEGEVDLVLGSLRLVYDKIQSPENSGKYSEIDLRFKNPVLR